MNLNLTGSMCFIGHPDATEVRPAPTGAAVHLKLADGRLVTIAGLTEDECRAVAPLFMDRTTLTLAPAGAQ